MNNANRQGSAQFWIMGCLGVCVLALALAIAGGMYLWFNFARPSMAAASPGDLRYFLDDFAENSDDTTYMRMLMINLDASSGETMLMITAVPPTCEVALMNHTNNPRLDEVMNTFALRHGSHDESGTNSITYELDDTFIPAVMELGQALAQYTGETWNYVWFGRAFELPEHIEVTRGTEGLSMAFTAGPDDGTAFEVETTVP
jgi:hypothetical protein